MFQHWKKAGAFRRIIEVLAADLQERGRIDLREAFIDGSFVPAKKRAVPLAGQNGAKAAGSWQITDASGLPVVCLARASPHEVTLAETALDSLFIAGKPEKLIGDKAYDSDKLYDYLLKKHGVELVAPHRSNRTKPKTQDGRKLRRYKRRWKVERLFAWLQNFRRLVVRYERHADKFLAFLLLAQSSHFVFLRYIHVAAFN